MIREKYPEVSIFGHKRQKEWLLHSSELQLCFVESSLFRASIKTISVREISGALFLQIQLDIFSLLQVFYRRFIVFKYFLVILGGFLTFWKIFETQDGGSKMAAVLHHDVIVT